MLGSNGASKGQPRQGFRIEWVDGAVSMELYPGAQLETIRLYTRVIEQFATPAANPATQLPAESSAGAQTTPIAPGTRSHDPDQESTGTSDTGAHSSAPNADHSDKPEWLSEAILRWRAEGGVTFSDTTWTYSYEPSFRQILELLGDTRRDVAHEDGTISPAKLDIRLADLTRRHFVQLHEQIKLIPQRQGKRNDGIEAKEVIRRAVAERAKPQSTENIAKKLRHALPCVRFLKKKGWINEALLDEFTIQLKDADARASKAKKQSKKGKAGAVGLSREEMRRTYHSQAYLEGAIQCDWKHWTDPLRIYSAARVSEIAQLLTSDIIYICGIPCISFVDDSPEDEDNEAETGGALSKARTEEEYRRLKNTASRRVIPVAPQLIEMGFLDFVEHRREVAGKAGPLFFGLKWEAKSGYGRKPSEHTLELLKTAGVWQKRRKVGHSLRATCAQHLDRLGMKLEDIQRYLGHSTGTELEESYMEGDEGPAYPAERIVKLLEQLDFGVQFPNWAEVLKLREERAREQQLSRKNGYARIRMTKAQGTAMAAGQG